MAFASLVVSIIAALFAFGSAYAAWRALRPRPKLSGSITSAWRLGASMDGRPATVVLIHVIFTNASTYPVHLLAYELHVKLGSGDWRGTTRMRSMRFTIPELYLSGGKYVATLTPEDLLDWPPKPVDYGAPLMGFLMFLLLGAADGDSVLEYRLTVTDVFGDTETVSITSAKAKAWQEGEEAFNVVELFLAAGAKVVERSSERGPDVPDE
jgi:hypothetical protein